MKKFTTYIRRIMGRLNDSACHLPLFLLCSIIAVVACLIVLPKQEFSQQENRTLQQFPTLSMEKITDGSFMDEMSDFIGDQFPGRQFFVSLNTVVCYAEGRRDIGGSYSGTSAESGVYFGKQNHLYEMLPPDRNKIFQKNAAGLISFAQKAKIPLYILPVPSGTTEQPENLPFSAPENEQRDELRELQSEAAGTVKVADLFDDLSLKKTGRDFYFKTDHHWNTDGAYVGYSRLCGMMNLQRTPQSQFLYRTVSGNFLGTLYSKALLPWQTPDSFVLPYKADGWSLTQVIGGTAHDGIYWNQYLAEKDKYSVYLGGNPGVTVIRNSAGGKGKILLLKDSYANSIIPYLATNFAEIHVVDLRYYNKNIYDYVVQNGIKQAAAVYSFSQLSEVPFANKLLK